MHELCQSDLQNMHIEFMTALHNALGQGFCHFHGNTMTSAYFSLARPGRWPYILHCSKRKASGDLLAAFLGRFLPKLEPQLRAGAFFLLNQQLNKTPPPYLRTPDPKRDRVQAPLTGSHPLAVGVAFPAPQYSFFRVLPSIPYGGQDGPPGAIGAHGRAVAGTDIFLVEQILCVQPHARPVQLGR